MAVLYVDEYGAVVRWSAGLLIVEKDGRDVASARIQELDYVVIQENCSLTSAAITALLKEGIDTAFVSRSGEYLGKLESPVGKNILLRRSQYQAADDPAFQLAIARRFVAAKLANMRTIIMRYARSDTISDPGTIPETLKQASQRAGRADSIEELLGIEGFGSREYFSVFGKLIPQPFSFTTRSRRPPKDEVNSMLGFAYALLENQVERAVSVCGLDPYCGFLHADHYGRQSLVLDLMEEFRPVIADSVVINCCIRGMVDITEDFEERDGGVYLNESGRQKFFRAFHNRMNRSMKSDTSNENDYTTICIRQARMLADCITSRSVKYHPYLIR